MNHYKKYGINKIFIYDNNNEINENFKYVIPDFIENGFVEIINYREKIKIQMPAFNHCYQTNKNKYDWFIFYDMDEFIHLNNYNNIKKYISKSTFNKCDIIYLNHVIHTDNNQIYYQNKSLFERFPEIENYANVNNFYQPRQILLDLTKMIVRGNLSNVNFENPHLLFNYQNNCCNGFGKIIKQTNIHLEKPDHKKFYYDHFYFKSAEEYLIKLNKGCVLYGVKRGFDSSIVQQNSKQK